jgi:hypothetical protein
MEFLPTHIVEWFVVPLAMYLLLFWWRDNLNILDMPLADLVALFAIADVAIVLNVFELPDVLRFLHADAIGCRGPICRAMRAQQPELSASRYSADCGS